MTELKKLLVCRLPFKSGVVAEGWLGVEEPWENLVGLGEELGTSAATLPKLKRLMAWGRVCFRGFEKEVASTKRLGTTGLQLQGSTLYHPVTTSSPPCGWTHMTVTVLCDGTLK